MQFKDIEELAAKLIVYDSGPAYEAFRESIVNDMLAHGYSRERADQVIDETVAHLKNENMKAKHGPKAD